MADQLFNLIGAIDAQAELIAAKIVGVGVDFSHEQGTVVTLHGQIVGNKTEFVKKDRIRGLAITEMEIVFAEQPGVTFVTDSHRSFTEGDRFWYPAGQTDNMLVQKGQAEMLNNGHSYRVTLRQEKSINLGQDS